MSKPSYRALQVALRIFSVLLAIGALFMIFGTRGLVIRVFLHPPEAEVSTLLLFLLWVGLCSWLAQCCFLPPAIRSATSLSLMD